MIAHATNCQTGCALETSYAGIQALTAAFVDPSYTLAREANATLTLEEWRRYAYPRTAENPMDFKFPGILLVLRNDFIRGLAAFRCTQNQSGMQTLFAENIVIMDRARKEQVSQDLLGGLLSVALRENCEGIHAVLPRSSAWLDKLWSDPSGNVYQLPIVCVRATAPMGNNTPDGTVVSPRSPSN